MAKRGGRFTKGDPAATRRSSHYGYDCYLAGPENTAGYVTCKLRPNRIPATIPDEQKLVLPPVLTWPFRDHACAHEMIDAVLERDVRQMEAWIQLHGPDHRFGFEDYVAWCRDQEGLAESELLSFPYGDPSHADLLFRLPLASIAPGCSLDFHVLRYPYGDAWGQVTIWSRRSVLTRFLVELVSGREVVTEHYPGRWYGIGQGDVCAFGAILRTRSLVRRRSPRPVPVAQQRGGGDTVH